MDTKMNHQSIIIIVLLQDRLIECVVQKESTTKVGASPYNPNLPGSSDNNGVVGVYPYKIETIFVI